MPKPLETIELPLEEPQTPEELPFPDANEFEVEEGISEDEIRREMEESFYNPEYDDLSEEDTSGVSVEEIEQAYKVLHNEIMVETVKESIVVNVLNSLNGTDMFEMLINTEESDKMAKSIMDRYIKKHASGSGSEEDSKFNIGNYLEK